MAKQKIHELAKELKLTNKAIVDYMNRKMKDKDKKYTASNSLEAEEAAEIRANREMLAKTDAKQSDAKAAGAKADAKQTEGKAKSSGESRPKKKQALRQYLMLSTASRARNRTAAISQAASAGIKDAAVL